MRFYTRQHQYYCGIDLHARTMSLCVLDRAGEIVLEQAIRCDPKVFLRTVASYRDDLVVAVECIFTWYRLADLCARENIPFVLGHALYPHERLGQSAAPLARANRLFYVHLNDNDGRWGWDMLPGAFHLCEFVELFCTLRKLGYTDDWYAFDVSPKEIDTVENFNAATGLTRKLEEITGRSEVATMEQLLKERNSSKTTHISTRCYRGEP